jgi:hypothetical protein
VAKKALVVAVTATGMPVIGAPALAAAAPSDNPFFQQPLVSNVNVPGQNVVPIDNNNDDNGNSNGSSGNSNGGSSVRQLISTALADAQINGALGTAEWRCHQWVMTPPFGRDARHS